MTKPQMRTVVNHENRGFTVCYTVQPKGQGRNAGISTRKWRFIPGENKIPQEILDLVMNHKWGKKLFDGATPSLTVAPIATAEPSKRASGPKGAKTGSDE